jgi:two-component system, OmpR family, copper resistance phosphate regulon response regulator CusR
MDAEQIHPYDPDMKILVVEDETAIADFVQRGLEAEGYSVECAGDGNEGERQALDGDPDLVVLDLMLPGRDGMSVLDSIRSEKPALPVIVLTAKDAVEDKVAGLDAGAVDYVTKPFSFDELTARIRARLREAAHHPEATTVDAAGIHVDLLSREVVLGDEAVHLSAREFDLLVFFMRHCDEVLSREQILSAVWGYDFDPGTNVVEVYVGYLRRKLAASGGPARIETLRSVGYRLTDR